MRRDAKGGFPCDATIETSGMVSDIAKVAIDQESSSSDHAEVCTNSASLFIEFA
jgi:hypothetical protein